MGNRPYSTFCFGYLLPDETEQPWGNATDFDDWLQETVMGYKNPHEYPFTKAGCYKDGFSTHDPKTEAYFKYQREWRQQNPLQFELCRHGSYDEPQHVLAPKSLVVSTDWDDIITVNFDKLLAALPDTVTKLTSLVQQCGVKVPREPKWYLLAFYG